MKIAHETTNFSFTLVQHLTDYDYALVHKMEEDEIYRTNFLNAKKAGREIILDNSIFELGEAFDYQKYFYWIEALDPTWYIIPDKLGDFTGTINNLVYWEKRFGRHLKGSKTIGVIQGTDYEQLAECYEVMAANVDKVAIPFDFDFYLKIAPHKNKWVSYMMGRVLLINWLLEDGIISVNKPHHLLGASNPLEMRFYKDYNFIDSVDTSSPIVAALQGVEYNDKISDWQKCTVKMADQMDVIPTSAQITQMVKNIEKFREYTRG